MSSSVATTDPSQAAVSTGLGSRVVPWVFTVAGLVGLTAAFVLAVEKYWLLTNPFYTPSCSINATVSCGPVMSSAQAAVFGFPNPFLGIAGFAIVAATGVMRLGGGRPALWYRMGMLAGSALGVVFVLWLMSQSLFVIGALCPYCMVVWVCTFATFWYSLLDLGASRTSAPTPLARFGVDHHSAVLAGLLLVLAVGVTWAMWSR